MEREAIGGTVGPGIGREGSRQVGSGDAMERPTTPAGLGRRGVPVAVTRPATESRTTHTKRIGPALRSLSVIPDGSEGSRL